MVHEIAKLFSRTKHGYKRVGKKKAKQIFAIELSERRRRHA